MVDYGTRLPYPITKPPENSFVFLTEWNNKTGKIVTYNGIGLRKTIDLDAATQDILSNLPIVFQDGSSTILYNGLDK
jgi:hypothetical protein